MLRSYWHFFMVHFNNNIAMIRSTFIFSLQHIKTVLIINGLQCTIRSRKLFMHITFIQLERLVWNDVMNEMSNCYLERGVDGRMWPTWSAPSNGISVQKCSNLSTVSHHLSEWCSTYGGQEKNSLPETCSVIVGLAGAIFNDLSPTIVHCCQSNSHQCIDRFVHLTILLWQMQW